METARSPTPRLPALEDPHPPDWQALTLPNTWADELRWWQLGGTLGLLRVLLNRRRRRVVVPERLPLAVRLPGYLKQEFHAIPNGNYSNRLVGPYVEGFDVSMLGRMQAVRRWVAQRFSGCDSALDVGCGGGKLAGVLHEHGVPDVWGIDASPYMLKYAARLHPHVNFIQGLAEALPFRDQRFAAAAVCFVFHELPPATADQVLEELARVLKPGAPLVIVEPGPEQLSTKNPFRLFQLAGLAGLYFGLLARFVYEPFVAGWHNRDQNAWLKQHGFTSIRRHDQFPLRVYEAKRSPRFALSA